MRIIQVKWATVCFCIVMVIMLIIGRYTYQDYGLTIDENVERQSAFINYQYAAEKLFGLDIQVFDDELTEWKDRYYGVALQMPMVAAEHLTGFTMPLRDAFLLRHLYTFVLSMCGWTCFYAFCRKVFRNGWLALLGLLMVVLYPRFWGEQFTNIKDLVFTATCCASLLCIALCLEREGKWRYEVFAAVVFALCSNTRFIGFQFPALLFGYRIVRDLLLERKKFSLEWMRKHLFRYLANIGMMFLVYFAVAPASWSDPAGYLTGVIETFSNYTTYEGNVLFLGTFYPANQLPWSYLSVWILISVPLWYLMLMSCGVFDACKQVVNRFRLKKAAQVLVDEYRYFVLCVVVALIPLVTPIFKEVTLYSAWRHVYYVFPLLIVVALFGVRWFWRKILRKRWMKNGAIAVLCVLLSAQAGWIIYNHPFEKVYFNPIGRTLADGLDRDYWNEADYPQIQTILRNDDTRRINISGAPFTGRTLTYYLPQDQAERFYVWYGYPPKIEYIIDSADTADAENYSGFTPVHELRMKDGLLLSTIHIRDDVLAERFGGIYPEYNIHP